MVPLRDERDEKISIVAMLFLMVGLPGAGKTMQAKSLAAEHAGDRGNHDAGIGECGALIPPIPRIYNYDQQPGRSQIQG